jgi:gamma-glutamylcysteine synthetase
VGVAIPVSSEIKTINIHIFAISSISSARWRGLLANDQDFIRQIATAICDERGW